MYLIDEDYLEVAPMSPVIKKQIRQNKRINLRWLWNLDSAIVEWFDVKISNYL